MTKGEILQTFSEINHYYNDCSRYDTLKRMLDELCDDVISMNRRCNMTEADIVYFLSWLADYAKDETFSMGERLATIRREASTALQGITKEREVNTDGMVRNVGE